MVTVGDGQIDTIPIVTKGEGGRGRGRGKRKGRLSISQEREEGEERRDWNIRVGQVRKAFSTGDYYTLYYVCDTLSM